MFKDSAATQEDSDVCIALFDPMRYSVPDPSGYDLNQLRNDQGAKMFRSLKVLKNSYGAEDIRIGLAFQPIIGNFKELPKLADMTPQIYQAITNNSYFLKQ